MTIDLDALEKLADQATPGKWRNAVYSRERVIVAGLTSKAFVKVLGKPPHSNGKDCAIQADANAAFIAAANPATIKALIAELKEARGLLAILDDHLGDDDEMWSDESTISTEWIGSDGIRRSLTFGLFRRIRAFLARNGKGEG